MFDDSQSKNMYLECITQISVHENFEGHAGLKRANDKIAGPASRLQVSTVEQM